MHLWLINLWFQRKALPSGTQRAMKVDFQDVPHELCSQRRMKIFQDILNELNCGKISYLFIQTWIRASILISGSIKLLLLKFADLCSMIN